MADVGYFVCEGCGIVDRDINRAAKGYPCSTCGDPSKGAHSYWSGLKIEALVQLMEEAHDQPDERWPAANLPVDYHRLAVVIFFCTLGEVLLENFLVECMLARQVSAEIRKRLLADSPFARQRVGRLFRTLTGKKWRDAVAAVGAKASRNYAETLSFYLHVQARRNELLHEGEVFAVAPDLPGECLQQTQALVDFFCALHNEFVQPGYSPHTRRYTSES